MKIIDLPFKVKRPILACGADIKGAFAIAEGDKAFLFEGFCDLGEVDNFERYEKAVKREIKKLKTGLGLVACDLHSGYFSTEFARNLQLATCNLRLCKVQHHEAHIASGIIDNGIKGNVIGVAFDGTGFGNDGNIWGGEFFTGNIKAFKRAAHLKYIPMPGGDLAVMEPWRMAVSYLYQAFGKKFLDMKVELFKKVRKNDIVLIRSMIDKKFNSPLTSSAGRLFDAVGSLVLGKENADFEAELPIELERLTLELCQDSYDFSIKTEKGLLIIDLSKTIRNIVKDLAKEVDRSTVSARFHNAIAGMISEVCIRLRKKSRINNVILSGGVFQNKFLVSRASALLKQKGFTVYTHDKIFTNDSGIPIGQIAIANFRQ